MADGLFGKKDPLASSSFESSIDQGGQSREAEAGILQARQQQVMGLRKAMDAPPVPYDVGTEQLKPLQIASGVPGDFTMDDAIDFMFGGELSVVGVKQDIDGWSWNWENMQQTWSEEPVWVNLLNTASLGASFVFPGVKGALKGAGLIKTTVNTLDDFKKIGLVDDTVKYLDNAEFKKLDNVMRIREKYFKGQQLDQQIAEGLTDAPELFKNPIDYAAYKWRQNFGNEYMRIAGMIGTDELQSTKYYHTVEELAKRENFGQFFDEMPKDGNKLYQHFLSRLDNTITSPSLTKAEQKWADAYWDYAQKTQHSMFEDGVISAEELARIGEAHIPAQRVGSKPAEAAMGKSVFLPLTKPGRKSLADEMEYLRLSKYEVPRLDWDTLEQRKSELPEIFDRMVKGQIITDPSQLTIRGLITDQMILNNFRFVRDLAMSDQARSHFDVLAKFGGDAKKAAKAGWMQIDHGLPPEIGKRLRRMMEKKGAVVGDEKMPWVRKEVFDELFGADGIFAQSVHQINSFEMLTAIHKTAKTVANIPTQFANIAGNMVFLGMRGFNMFSPENINLFQASAKAFNQVAETYGSIRKSGVPIKEVLANKKLQLGTVKVGGKVLNMADEILDPQVRDLIEESAFEYAEGFAHLDRLAQGMKKGNAARTIADVAVKAKKAAQFGDKAKWMDKMSKMYLGGDMVPKMAYYLSLRGKGLTKAAAVAEVGRALPMYSTVGAKIKSGRRVIWPWLSFPVEAARIMKNNLHDYPIRAAVALHTPQIFQTAFAMTGAGPTSREELQESKRALPLWAQKQTSVVGSQGAMETVGGGLSGGLAGGIAGAIAGGAPGGILGAAAGAAAGVGATKALASLIPGQSENLRGAVLDWLPHASILPQTISPDAGTFAGLPGQDFNEMLGNLPVQPLGILQPFMNIMTGRTPFGEDIGATSKADQLERIGMGFLEWMTPPILSKYMFKSYGPQIPINQAVGLGTAPDVPLTNVTRGLIDVGIAIDPNTGKPGSPSVDGFLNNFSFWKSYAASPEQRLINEGRAEGELSKVRTSLSRDLSFHLENGNNQQITQILGAVMSTFTRQYADNPRMAQEKYGEWLKRRKKEIGRHPRLRGWSQEELEARLRKANDFAGNERSRVKAMLTQAINEQLAIRRSARSGKGGLGAGKFQSDLGSSFNSNLKSSF